ncbi:2-oxoglutarate dehydrogenase E2 component (dihydrolipoamide succinyltransferase) [Paenibacillus phyllosphaerae]|uniref:Dihydrolipoyllysine-residue succinyltransferase component of 2-oxoglutarate dehydrogenase complex n=1 Tax=Paenibacillus phyllosphaerae TaxID=274593 RepID=A0A7W5AYS2_9BACL|nr:2-oxoglutarate dehydrogenase complex dihydrolipoyllysine-residue succinyltransferase [Paenibacillus phyllosphaerae]MBB3111270.1 2-oxoglutarate dehydrogenase E2 component (dihydrolipoamide succinyltransferase) [Paenibacillus phyllosphaerae]
MSEIKVPEMGESITEGTIAKWVVKVGDQVNQGDVLVELETDKVNLEISADESGVLTEIVNQEGDTVAVGAVIGRIGAAAAGGSPAPAAQPAAAAPAPTPAAAPAAVAVAAPPVQQAASYDAASVAATPAARKLARERGIDLQQVATADPIGRIGKDDVKNHTERKVEVIPQAVPAAVPAVAPAAVPGKPVDRRPMSRRRQTIANRLVEAQRTAAMLTTFNEVDMTAILDVRKRRKDAFKDKHDVNLGFMSFFTKAVVGALKAYPLLNAEIQGTDILVKKFYDIGIAVSAKEGLVVPVVRDADRLGFAAIEKEISDLAVKARNNKLDLGDLQGGTFTITNGGVFGSLLSTPILNAPQVGILGMHKIQLRPVAIDAERMENRPMMYIALSYDHRIVDGAEAVRFLVTVKELLEDPETLLLEG